MRPSSHPGTLGDVIRRRRQQLGWSQEELAARASGPDDEVRQSDISRLELGKVGLPRRARLQRIATALDMPLGELLARSGWAAAGSTRSVPAIDALNAPAPNLPAGRGEWAAEWSAAPVADRSSGTIVRLHDAIAEARLTMARSAT